MGFQPSVQLLRATAAEENSTATSSSQDNLNFANTGASARLSALRGGASGVSVDDMAFNIGGQQIPTGALVGAVGALLGITQSDAADAGGGLLDNRWGLFFTGIARDGNRDAVRGTLANGATCVAAAGRDCVTESGFDFDGWQALMGVDFRFSPKFVAGLALGAGKISAELGAAGGGLESRSRLASIYGSLIPSANTYLDFTYTRLNNRYEQFRVIDLRAGNSEFFDARAKYRGSQNSVSLSGGYVFGFGANSFTPNVRISTGRTTIDAFSKTGRSIFNLNIKEQKFNSLQYAVGFNFNRAISFESGVLLPYVNFELTRENKNKDLTLTPTFVRNGVNAAPINISKADSSFGRGELGFTFVREGGWQFGLSYSQTLAYQYLSSRSIQLTGRIEF